MTPLLSVLLVHDFLFSKNGISAPPSHPLRQAIDRHKTRIKGEFTKARVRRGCASVQDLQAAVLQEKRSVLGSDALSETSYPRWVRINNLKSDLDSQLRSTFAGFQQVSSLADLKSANSVYVDEHVPDLVALAPGGDISSSSAYQKGEIILQDKASCFPAYLLLGDQDVAWTGDLVDGCAAPGNKTTHLASLLCARNSHTDATIFSMDASADRSKTLQKMVSVAGADKLVSVLAGQDFLAVNHADPRFKNVTGLLLDPSCSGSGIIGRDDMPRLVLPELVTKSKDNFARGKKRKRTDGDDAQSAASARRSEPSPPSKDRLSRLANLQARIVEHALGFPAATRVTYSTCSIYILENELVVSRVLSSKVAMTGGWRLMRRDEQPRGLRKWKHRGIRQQEIALESFEVDLSEEQLDSCIRCWPGDDQGTGGFFVAGFVRDQPGADVAAPMSSTNSLNGEDGYDDDEDEWNGFSD